MNISRYFLTIITILYFITLLASPGNATEEYAEMTASKCKLCHIDPLGGGQLTETGKGYLLSVSPEALQNDEKRGAASQLIRLIFLYIHITTAFLWFGTILYVHLVLKPAYASKGLPRGEVKVGIVSIVIMAITGSVLTYYKVPSLSLLFSSNFGILLFAKVTIFTIMASSAILVVFVIGPRLKKNKSLQAVPSGNLSVDQLAEFDGDQGRSAYFAYKGKIYDVSQSRFWKHGNHMKRK